MSAEATEAVESREEFVDSPTRPTNVTRTTSRAKTDRRVLRFTVDLEREQHNFLRFFAINNGINASVVIRTLLFELETNRELAQQIIDTIFGGEEEDSENEE